MKRIIWPYLHRFNFNRNLSVRENPWGWIPQEIINNIANSNIPKTESNLFFPEDWEDRQKFYEIHFKNGAKIGYNMVKKSFYEKDNFLENYYLTPKLSLALNNINSFIAEKNIRNKMETTKINDIEILGSWVQIGITKTNKKFLGMWDKEFIKHELITGSIGPEIRHLWDQKPIKQTIRVLYKLDNRIDIFDWERCLITDNYEWTVSNINNVIY